MEYFGILCLIPTLVVVSLAVLVHRPVFSLLASATAELIMINPSAVVSEIADLSFEVVRDETIS